MSGLTPRIGTVAARELAVHGITTHDQVAAMNDRDLLAIHGVSPKAVRILREEIAGAQ